LSCPDTIHATISSGNILPQIAGNLPVQIDLIRNGCSAYEQSLAASCTLTLLIHRLRTPSIQIFNVLFAIDGRMMYSWLICVDKGPYFTELVNSVYQAVKIWGWSISVSAAFVECLLSLAMVNTLEAVDRGGSPEVSTFHDVTPISWN
jgi:hypothetical protein